MKIPLVNSYRLPSMEIVGPNYVRKVSTVEGRHRRSGSTTRRSPKDNSPILLLKTRSIRSFPTVHWGPDRRRCGEIVGDRRATGSDQTVCVA